MGFMWIHIYGIYFPLLPCIEQPIKVLNNSQTQKKRANKIKNFILYY